MQRTRIPDRRRYSPHEAQDHDFSDSYTGGEEKNKNKTKVRKVLNDFSFL